MGKLLRGIVLSLVAVVALTGCLKIEGSFVIHEDDTVDGTFLLAVQKGIGDSMGMSDEDLLSQMTEDLSADDLDGASVRPYEDEDWVGQQVVLQGQPVTDLAEDDAGLTVVREGDVFVVQGDPLATASDDEDMDLASLPGAEATMSVTFPGEVIETNGEVDGTTVTWDLLALDEPMYARGQASAGFVLPDWAWYAAGGVLILGSVGIVVGVVVSRRRGGTALAAEAAAAGAPEAQAGTVAPRSFEPEPVEDAAGATVPEPQEPAPTEPLPYAPPRPSEEWPGAAPESGEDAAPTEQLPSDPSAWAPPPGPERP